MSKESSFLIYCLERYRHFKGLSGANAARMDISQSILKRCIPWAIIISYRILMTVSAAKKSTNVTKAITTLKNLLSNTVNRPTVNRHSLNLICYCNRKNTMV